VAQGAGGLLTMPVHVPLLLAAVLAIPLAMLLWEVRRDG
jgi:hypothetical protein